MTEELQNILTENGIGQKEAEMMSLYGQYLINENEKYNLTRITDVKDLAVKHFLDSVSVLSLKGIDFDTEVLDIGTGPGFPGIPYAVSRPRAHVTLLDSSNKKIQFIDEGIKELGIDNAETLVGRAEELSHDDRYREMFGLVLSRAVASLNILIELAAGFVRQGGYFIAYKGANADQELELAGDAPTKLGFSIPEIYSTDLVGQDHKLIVFHKTRHTDDKYPRIYGKIKKAPLG